MKDKKFKLEHQFELYLQRVGLTRDKMAANQYIEMKRCFIGACGQMLILLRDDLGALSEEEAIEKMKDMIHQVGQFFIIESNRQK